MLLLLPVLTGLLLAASFPLCNQHYLAWIAFIPLIVFVLRVKSPVMAFWGGCIAGGIQLCILLVWMPVVLQQYGELPLWLAWTGYVILILLLSCFSGIACLWTKSLMRRGGDSLLLLFPAVWILIEFLQTKIPFGGFPWLTMGYSQSEQLAIIQVADLTGVYGVSFLLIWFSTALSHLGLHRGRGIRAWWPLGVAVALTLICLFYGTASLNRWEKVPSDYKVVLLQGNLSPDDPPAVLEEKYLFGYERMVENLESGDADLLILPESPTPPGMYQWDAEYKAMLENLARRYTFGMIFNNIRIEDDAERLLYYNSAYFMDGTGIPGGIYDKTHLVPFGEYLPAKDLFGFMKTITQDVGGFHRGSNYELFTLGGHPVNATICFETIFPGLVRKFVRSGSQLIINMTNDGWYGSSSAPFQHFNIARWRAIENRRYFLRSANTGISAVIEPSGRMHSATAILRQAVCEGRFGFVTQQTFYTRYGDAFIFLCAIIVFGCTIFVFAKGPRRGPFHNR